MAHAVVLGMACGLIGLGIGWLSAAWLLSLVPRAKGGARHE